MDTIHYAPTFATVASTDLTDATTLGRSLLTASTAAAARTAMGILDMTDEASSELAHANQVCGFTYNSILFVPDAYTLIDSLGSRWHATGSGSTTATRVLSGEDGGTVEVTTGVSASQTSQLGTSITSIFTNAFSQDLVLSTSKWHVQFDAKFPVTPDATTNIGVGWTKTDAAAFLMFGILGGVSTAKFCLNNSPETNSATKSVLSTVSIDTNWHRFRFWADGLTPGTVYGSVDGETPVSITGLTWGAACGAWVHACNGTTSANQKIRMKKAYYRVDGDSAA